LSKKAGGSPGPSPPPVLQHDRSSPLRDIENSSFLNRGSVERPSKIAVRTPSGNYNSSPVPEPKGEWKATKDDVRRISSAMRRISIGSVGPGASATALRAHRRRSPPSATYGSSPPENTMFTAQARRMTKGDNELENKPAVLGPRTLPIMKNTSQRRTTFGGDIRPRNFSLTGRDAVRLSAIGGL
jgi:kinesin family protein 18/19